jgi:Flp pilus assembly protein TadG
MMMNNSKQKRSIFFTRIFRRVKGRSRGQGMVEFALAIPFILMLFGGLIEFGFFFFVYSSVNTASREAARYGAAAGDSEYGVPYFRDCRGIRDAARRIGGYAGLTDSQIDVGMDKGPGTSVDWTHCPAGQNAAINEIPLGDRLVVNIHVTYHPVASFLGIPPIQIRSLSARTIVRELDIIDTPGPPPTEVTPESSPPPTEVTPDPPTCTTPEELGGCP